MDDLFRKIQGLLSKAEGTDNEHEASAFYAKANELMLKYAVDEQALREAMGTAKRSEVPIKVDYEYSSTDSNARGKASLLNVVARANRVRMVNYTNRRGQNKILFGATNVASQWCGLVGYASDIEYVKMLYVSLLIQAARFAAKAYREEAPMNAGWNRKPAGKSAFVTAHLIGFSTTISERFNEMKPKVEASTSALIVRIDEDVNKAYREFFPSLRSVGFHSRSSAGMSAGRRDGHNADIGNPALGRGSLRLSAGR